MPVRVSGGPCLRCSTAAPAIATGERGGELLKLCIDIGETSAGTYILRRRKPPSQNWRPFLENHVKTMVSIIPSPTSSSPPITEPGI